jgi:hypothetical protein
MRKIFPFLLLFLFAENSFAQKMVGFGGELSMLGLKPNVRMWVSRNTGIEIFTGLDSELGDFKPDDLVAGFKFLHSIFYKRNERTYFGVVGKWKWINVYGSSEKTNLPIPGILIGKEWYIKQNHLKGLAIELGYQIGNKEYEVYSPINHILIGRDTFEEFPLILNLRYSFYKRK